MVVPKISNHHSLRCVASSLLIGTKNRHFELLKLHHRNLVNEMQETSLMMNMYQQQQQERQQQQQTQPAADAFSLAQLLNDQQQSTNGSLNDGSTNLTAIRAAAAAAATAKSTGRSCDGVDAKSDDIGTIHRRSHE
jgi:hypothetical protein